MSQKGLVGSDPGHGEDIRDTEGHGGRQYWENGTRLTNTNYRKKGDLEHEELSSSLNHK